METLYLQTMLDDNTKMIARLEEILNTTKTISLKTSIDSLYKRKAELETELQLQEAKNLDAELLY